MARIKPAFPAVTCTAQADYLTGQYPDTHGIVGNGWYSREEARGPVLEAVEPAGARRRRSGTRRAPPIRPSRARTCSGGSTCIRPRTYSVTPRPMYPADGRKIPDVYTSPSSLRDELQSELGTFPLFEFWGPRASINSTRWIADAAKRVEQKHNPTLTLVYLPHLDYNLQRVGPGRRGRRRRSRQVDEVAADLIAILRRPRRARDRALGVRHREVSKPVHINRVLRERGLIAVRAGAGTRGVRPWRERGVRGRRSPGRARLRQRSAASCTRCAACSRATPGVDAVLDESGQRDHRIDHARARAISSPSPRQTRGSPTTTGWTIARAPDYARTVDIHRKPGYDPVELFLDPAIRHSDAAGRVEAGQAKGRVPDAARRHPARRHAGQGVARAGRPAGTKRARAHQP